MAVEPVVEGETVEFSCVWVAYLPKGIDLTRYKRLRFVIRGASGEERIIFKAKDINGSETAFELVGNYLLERHMSTRWQEADVPFANLKPLDLSRMDNISLASNGQLNGRDSQTIFVGQFRFD